MSSQQNVRDGLGIRFLKSLSSMPKCDKYIRLICNICKYLRALDDSKKKQLALLYKQLLVVRQVIRWQGLYQFVAELITQGNQAFKWDNIGQLAFGILGCIGDVLDRLAYWMSFQKDHCKLIDKLQQMQQDCYFLECTIQLLFHIRTVKKTFEGGTADKKKQKILKILKYVCDTMTSYCKFSHRVWELSPVWGARLGLCSSLIGIYDILK